MNEIEFSPKDRSQDTHKHTDLHKITNKKCINILLGNSHPFEHVTWGNKDDFATNI